VEKKAQSLAVRPGCTRFTCASIFFALLASFSSFFSLSESLLVGSSSVFSLSGSLSPSSQVSQGALCLLRYDGSGRVHCGHPDVLVSSSLSSWRHELQVIQRMRRLSARHLEAEVRQ
jgi:hypothetical protein